MPPKSHAYGEINSINSLNNHFLSLNLWRTAIRYTEEKHNIKKQNHGEKKIETMKTDLCLQMRNLMFILGHMNTNLI